MPRTSWNKGLTKETNESVRKISETMKRKKIDNFQSWRKSAIEKGLIVKKHSPLKKDGNLAELIGAVLGDGHIEKFPRCEALYLTFHADDKELVQHYVTIIENVFSKTPHVAKQAKQESTRIRLYQKDISKRLEIPTGARGDYKVVVPRWIENNREYIIRYLRGLYEAEGTIAHHEGTYTHKMIFSNRNDYLLDVVYRLLEKVGFHPHVSKYKVQISRKDEVQKLENLLHFRSY